MEFKSSKEFVIILKRLIWHFEHRMIEVSDIYYDGIYIEDRNLNYKSIAVLCKSMNECEKVYKILKNKTDIKIIDGNNENINGVVVMHVYMAKGLEFNCVIVYEANSSNYKTEFDKRLLYIASTRALHKLVLFYTGSKSKYLEQKS